MTGIDSPCTWGGGLATGSVAVATPWHSSNTDWDPPCPNHATGAMDFTVKFATGHTSVLQWYELKKLAIVANYIKTLRVDMRIPQSHRALWLQKIDPVKMAKAKRPVP
jgi:hypothetical protein